ncbi:MAG TPA: peptidylprolyl isomerase [Patescibacteria group bacterium]|nr:peptidylprolyl isomerase [Patescibacteria group bacterium]
MTKKSRRQLRTEMAAKNQRRNRLLIGLGAVVVIMIVLLLLFNLFFNQEDEDLPRALEEIAPALRNGFYTEYPPMSIDPSKDYSAIIRTANGDITLRLFAEESPLAVNNFVYLTRQGYYDGLTFHRVIKSFMAQGGDPTGQGSGGPGYSFEDETDNSLVFDKPGILAMANRGPATNGSQFFITFAATPHLNGLHTIFGELTAGQSALDALIEVAPDGITPATENIIQRIDIVEE